MENVVLTTNEKLEYRHSRMVEGKNGNYYLHTFESATNTFTFYCKEDFKCKKGQFYKLQFSLSVYNNNNNFTLLGVVNE